MIQLKKVIETFLKKIPQTDFLLRNKTVIIHLSVPVLIIFLYVCFLFRPKIKELLLLSAEVKELRTKVVQTKKDWENIEQLKIDASKMSEKIDYFEKRLPSEKEISSVLEYLSDAARKLEVKLTEIKPLEQQEDQKSPTLFYYKIPILLKAECSYHALGRFLNKLESADRFMKISDIKMADKPAEHGILYVQLIVVTYVMGQQQ